MWVGTKRTSCNHFLLMLISSETEVDSHVLSNLLRGLEKLLGSLMNSDRSPVLQRLSSQYYSCVHWRSVYTYFSTIGEEHL